MEFFSDENNINNKNTVVSALLNLHDSGQDRTIRWHHEGENPFDFIGVLDGHGTIPRYETSRSTCTHFVDAVENLSAEIKEAIFCAENPMEALIEYFSGPGKNSYHHSTGAVASFARIYSDRIESFNVGDANTLIYLDGNLVYMNKHHEPTCPEEKERLDSTIGSANYRVDPATKLVVTSPTDINQVYGTYTLFFHLDQYGRRVETMLAPSQSLGHNNITGYKVSRYSIPYLPSQHVKVVVATDGVMDMVYTPANWYIESNDALPDDLQMLATSNAIEIASWARKRWGQEWTTHAAGYSPGKQTFPENKLGQDDVGVVTFTQEAVVIGDDLV